MNDLLRLIGKPSTDAGVRAFLLKRGAPEPRIMPGESDVYLNLYTRGLSLLFEDANYFAGQHGLELSIDAPMLSAAFFYGPGDDQFHPFQGDLPRGLQFDLCRVEVQECLGRPVLVDEEFNTEAWDIGGGLRLFVDYGDAKRQSVRVVQLSFFAQHA